MDFSKRKGGRAAKDEVAAFLDEIEPRWRRLYVLYPTEDGLRRQERRGAGSRESAGQLREDRQVSVKLDPLKSTDAERQ